VNSEHFQSLKQPEAKTSKENQEQKTEQKYGKTNRTSEEVRESYMSQFQNKKSKTVQDTVSNNKNQMNTQQIDGTTKVNSENAQNTKVNQKKTNSRIKEMPIEKQTSEQENIIKEYEEKAYKEIPEELNKTKIIAPIIAKPVEPKF